jgi:hypothetical protein
MIQVDRIGDYLRQLTPQAGSCLLIELERLEASGNEVPGAASLLENLRAEFRKSDKNASSHRQSVAAFLQAGGIAASRRRART